MAKKRICIILSAILCLCLGAFVLMQFLPKAVDVSANTYSSADFKMVNDSSIKKDTDLNGIRFMTFIGDESEQAKEGYWETHEMGTLFIPEKAMKSGDELKIGGTYSGISPVVAKFDGNLENLDTNEDYSGGKVFNAVLDLTKFNTNAGALNYKIVARTYVKDTESNQVTYLDAIKYSPALSAGLMIESGDSDQMLLKYIDKVEFSGVTDVNVSTTDPIALNVSTNVEGFPFKYSTDSGTLNGNQFVPKQNTASTITVTLVGGKKSESFKVSHIDPVTITLERKYYAEKDARQVTGNSSSESRNSSTDYLILEGSGITGVELNGETITARWYTISSDKKQISIVKAKLLSIAKSSNDLTLKCSGGDIVYELNLTYGGEEALPSSLDYSNSTKKFNITAYASVSDGENLYQDTNTFNPFFGKDYIAEYYDCGMELLQGGGAAPLWDKATSLSPAADIKVTMDRAHEVGKDNSVIVTENGIIYRTEDCLSNNFSSYTVQDVVNGNYPTFIGNGSYQFANITALDEFVYKRVEMLNKNQPGFGGIMLTDEPEFQEIPLVAEMYKSIQRAYQKLGLTNKKIVVNLLPFYSHSSSFPAEGTDRQEGYRKYVDLWLTLSGSKQLQMDIYSLFETGIYRQHIINLQIAAEVAKKHNAKIEVINSSWKRSTERFHTYQDMAWMNNITLAYGASNFGWYTYHMDSADTTVLDGASPLTRAGKKTEIYDYVREINSKAQVFAPVILNFDYVKGEFVNNLNSSDEPKDTANGNIYSKTQVYTSNSINQGLTKVTKVKANDGKYSWLVNELKDSSKGNYMYAVMNVIDSLNTTSDHATKKSITLTFASGYTKAWVYRDGKFTVESLNGSTLTLSNMIGGDCCYVIPF